MTDFEDILSSPDSARTRVKRRNSFETRPRGPEIGKGCEIKSETSFSNRPNQVQSHDWKISDVRNAQASLINQFQNLPSLTVASKLDELKVQIAEIRHKKNSAPY